MSAIAFVPSEKSSLALGFSARTAPCRSWHTARLPAAPTSCSALTASSPLRLGHFSPARRARSSRRLRCEWPRGDVSPGGAVRPLQAAL
eukprot:6189990-Prymnesium_polylepis.2